MEDLFKYVTPAAVFLLWLRVLFSKESRHTKVATAYLMSVGVFSFNWAFYFRELHQTLHAVVALLGLWALGTRGVPKFNFGLLPFAAAILVSVVAADALDDPDSQVHLINFGLIVLVVNYFRGYCWNQQSMQACMRFLAQAGTMIAALGLVEWLLISEGRIKGPMSNPNYFGFYLGVAYIAAFYSWDKWRRTVALGTILVAIVLCGSRAAFLFPIAHAAFYFLRTKSVLRRTLMISAVAGVAVFMMLSEASRFTSKEAVAGSDGERKAFMHIALDMASDYPLTGVGWGRFPAEFWGYAATSDAIIYSLDQEVDVTREERRVTHNDLLRVLAELGYVAAGFALAVIVVGLWKFARADMPMADALAPLWLGNVAFAMTHNNMNSALFWLLFLLPFFGALPSAEQRKRAGIHWRPTSPAPLPRGPA